MDGSLRRLHHVSEHLFISYISLMFSADDKLVTNYDQLPQVFFLTVLRSSGGGRVMKNPFQYYVLLIDLLRIGYFFIPQILNVEHFFYLFV